MATPARQSTTTGVAPLVLDVAPADVPGLAGRRCRCGRSTAGPAPRPSPPGSPGAGAGPWPRRRRCGRRRPARRPARSPGRASRRGGRGRGRGSAAQRRGPGARQIPPGSRGARHATRRVAPSAGDLGVTQTQTLGFPDCRKPNPAASSCRLCMIMRMAGTKRIGIVGASGFTGAELLRLCAGHAGRRGRAGHRRQPGRPAGGEPLPEPGRRLSGPGLQRVRPGGLRGARPGVPRPAPRRVRRSSCPT